MPPTPRYVHGWICSGPKVLWHKSKRSRRLICPRTRVTYVVAYFVENREHAIVRMQVINWQIARSLCGSCWESRGHPNASRCTSRSVARGLAAITTSELERVLRQRSSRPAMPHVQLVHSSNATLMSKLSGHIRIRMQHKFQTVPQVLRLFQELAHCHDLGLSRRQIVQGRCTAVRAQAAPSSQRRHLV